MVAQNRFMPSNLTLRNYEEKDKPEILQLHQVAIGPVTLDMYPIYRTGLERRLVPDQIVVAEVKKKVAGFISFERFDQMPYSNLLHFLHMLTLAQYPENEANTRDNLKKVKRELRKGSVTLEYFDLACKINIFGIPGESMMGANMVVSGRYRNNGMGYALAHHALDKVLERKPPVIFTQLIDGSPSVSICDKLGFKSLLRYGPNYSNGAATHLMIYDPTGKL